jgi:plasmid maintenance system killer protein
MPRVRVDPGYLRARKRLSSKLAERADAALVKFLEDSPSPGLNFEALQNWPGYYSIRVNRNFRILLRREQDDSGEVFAAVDVASHDVYRRQRGRR